MINTGRYNSYKQKFFGVLNNSVTSFTEVQLTNNELHIFKVYTLINFEVSMPSQESEHIHHPEKFPNIYALGHLDINRFEN